MTTVLLTGFEPFAGAASNSSWDAVERVAQDWSGDAELVIELLPVTFAGASASMRELIARSEAAGVWTLQAGIFPENTASLALHARHGFREVGRRERLGKMPPHGPRAGEWRDVLLLERRSRVAGA